MDNGTNSNYVGPQDITRPVNIPDYNGPVIIVRNQRSASDLKGTVSNPAPPVCARQPGYATDITDFKLLVGPCSQGNSLAGDYWPIHAEYDPDPNYLDGERYSVVAVVAGQPNVVVSTNPTKCTTPTSGTGFESQGLWILSRDPDPENVKDLIKATKKNLNDRGISTALLKKVTQVGCDYKGRWIKLGQNNWTTPALKCDHWCDEYTCDKDQCIDCPICHGVRTRDHCSSWCNVYTCVSSSLRSCCEGYDVCLSLATDGHCALFCNHFTCWVRGGFCNGCASCGGTPQTTSQWATPHSTDQTGTKLSRLSD